MIFVYFTIYVAVPSLKQALVSMLKMSQLPRATWHSKEADS